MTVLRDWLPTDRTQLAWVRDLRRILTASEGGIRWGDNISPLVPFRYVATVPTTQTLMIPAVEFFFGSGYVLAGGGKLQATAANALCQCNLNPWLTSGQTITQIRYMATPGTAEAVVANRTRLTCQTLTYRYSTPAGVLTAAQFDVNDVGTNVLQVVSTGTISLPVDTAAREIELTFEATNTVGAGTVFDSIEVQLTDPNVAVRSAVDVLVDTKDRPLAVFCLRATKTGAPAHVESGARVEWEWRGSSIRIHGIDLSSATDEYDVTLGLLMG
jgi:hypothetical protein